MRPAAPATATRIRWSVTRPTWPEDRASWMPGGARRAGTVPLARPGSVRAEPAPRGAFRRSRGSCERPSGRDLVRGGHLRRGRAEGVLVGADAGRRQALGRPQLVGERAQVVEGHGVDALHDL